MLLSILPSWFSGFYVFIILAIIYLGTIFLLEKKGFLKKWNVEIIWYCFLMIRTNYGKKIIGKIASKRNAWTKYANLAIIVCLVSMCLNFLMLVWEFIIVTITEIPEEAAPTANMLLGLPGINPFIPIGYGILGLVVAMVIHEGGHGILTVVEKIKLKSLGILVCILPIGAFVEPDEEQLGTTTRKKRSRIYAAGPFTNILCAVLLGLVFSGLFMTSVSAPEGVAITLVVDNSPAANASLSQGMIITRAALIVNDSDSGNGEPVFANVTDIRSSLDFSNFLVEREPGQTIFLNITRDGEQANYAIVLANRMNFSKSEDDNGTPYLGVGYMAPKATIESLRNPIYTDGIFLGGFFTYILLPLTRLSPFPAWFTSAVTLSGPLGFLPAGVFWFLANCIYWIFWLNLMVGTTNTLPMLWPIPLDGGNLFRDGLDYFFKKYFKGMSKKNRWKWVARICYGVGGFIVFTIIWLVVGPRVMPYVFDLFR